MTHDDDGRRSGETPLHLPSRRLLASLRRPARFKGEGVPQKRENMKRACWDCWGLLIGRESPATKALTAEDLGVIYKEVGRLELPSIVVTFPESDVDEWMQWYDKAIAKGDRSDQYTTGAITYYASDSTTELMRIELAGVSLLSLEIDKYEAHKEAIAQAKATLNIEQLKLKPGKGTV